MDCLCIKKLRLEILKLVYCWRFSYVLMHCFPNLKKLNPLLRIRTKRLIFILVFLYCAIQYKKKFKININGYYIFLQFIYCVHNHNCIPRRMQARIHISIAVTELATGIRDLHTQKRCFYGAIIVHSWCNYGSFVMHLWCIYGAI